MWAVSRFHEPSADFQERAQEVVAFWKSRTGCISADVLQNLDDPSLWAIISHWESVGAYRRSFSGMEAKMILTPVLSAAIDEPSAFLDPAELGANQPRELL